MVDGETMELVPFNIILSMICLANGLHDLPIAERCNGKLRISTQTRYAATFWLLDAKRKTVLVFHVNSSGRAFKQGSTGPAFPSYLQVKKESIANAKH